MKKIFKIFLLLYKSAVRTIEQDGVEHAGYISFMLLLSIFPFIVFFLAFTSFFGASELGKLFIEFLINNAPENTIDAIKGRVTELTNTPPQSLLTLAICGCVWTSSSLVESLRTILNRVYEVKTPPPYIFRRILSILQCFMIILLINFILFLSVILPNILNKITLLNIYFPPIAEFLQEHNISLQILRYSLILSSLFFTASSLYYIIPNIKMSFKEVMPGALLATSLWIFGGYIVSSYIGYYYQLTLVYGSLGKIIVSLIFFYIINFIFIYAAEFNYLMQHKNNF